MPATFRRTHRALLIGVPFSRRKISSQFFRIATWPVTGSVALNAPAFFQGASIHGVEPELVQKVRDYGLGAVVVTGDRQRATTPGPCRLSMGSEFRRMNVIEGLHHP